MINYANDVVIKVYVKVVPLEEHRYTLDVLESITVPSHPALVA